MYVCTKHKGKKAAFTNFACDIKPQFISTGMY